MINNFLQLLTCGLHLIGWSCWAKQKIGQTRIQGHIEVC